MPYVSAKPSRRGSVVYIADDGGKMIRSGGSRSWRNNNPGNLRYTRFSRDHGAIGTAGGFAVFPDYQTGRAALSALLHGPSYSNLSIYSAVARYAPPQDNDTESYRRLITRITGLDIQRKLTNIPMHGIVATSLLVIALVGAGGVFAALLHGAVLPAQLTLLFAVATAAGMLAGRSASRRLSDTQVQVGFAVVLLVVAVGLFVKAASSV